MEKYAHQHELSEYIGYELKRKIIQTDNCVCRYALFCYTAWIYCRIDAPEDTHGVLKGQHEKLDSYANQMYFTVVGSSHDLGNGLTLNHPGLTELMEATITGKVDVLIIDSINRIGRDTKQVLEFLHKLNGYGVRGKQLPVLKQLCFLQLVQDLIRSYFWLIDGN